MKKNIVWISLGVAAAAGTAILLGGWLAGWKEVKIDAFFALIAAIGVAMGMLYICVA